MDDIAERNRRHRHGATGNIRSYAWIYPEVLCYSCLEECSTWDCPTGDPVTCRGGDIRVLPPMWCRV